jgi:antitoxin component of RelBE/YafQ-DinJ toxin-antitoxin module
VAAQIPVRIDEDVYRNARTVAAYRGTSVSEYISSNMRQIAAEDMAKMAKEIQTEGPAMPKAEKAERRGRKAKKDEAS